MKRRRDAERPESVEEGSQAWYVDEGKRGELLLNQGQIDPAIEAFEAILARLAETPSYARAVILGRLGRCCHVGGRSDLAVRYVRDAIDVIGRLAPSDGVKSLRGTLRSELGDALRASGQYDDARKAYEAALKIAEELKDLRGQGVELARLGALALTQGKLDEALTRQQAARRLFQRLHEPDMEAAACHQLGRIYHQQQQSEDAERHYRESARISQERGRPAAVAQTWSSLADLLQNQPNRLADARQLAEEALAVGQSLDPTAAETWTTYGLLAEIVGKQARAADERERRTALETLARDSREVQRYAPIVLAALAQIGESSTYGRAVLLGQLGRCFHMGRRPDLAAAYLREAIRITAALTRSDGVKGLGGALHLDLGDALQATGQDAAAREAHEAALRIAEELHDVRGKAHASQRLGGDFQATSSRVPRSGPQEERRQRDERAAFEVTIYEDLTTDFVFEPDLLVDGPRGRRIIERIEEVDPPAADVRPMLVPCARTWMDDEGAIHFSLPLSEPIVERHPGCTSMRRIRRELEISGSPRTLWRLVQEMDGAHTVVELLSKLPADEQAVARRMLAALTATGIIDVSGRAVGRFIHSATKKGVLPAGGLEGDAVLRLATDGNYRTYPHAPRISVGQSIPDRLDTFHALTRARRSSRDYRGVVSRGDFDALLHTACGVTGTMSWAEREVKLRAYPSSGALYAVEIYPVVFRVEGLEPAVYHYHAVDSVLEVVSPGLDLARVVGAALPVEREMVAGAAAVFCLTGCFPRHERKYGEGGYRMLVAEAGHISQNLILASTALGLSARPFGGVFDDLVNDDLGLDRTEEQFLLAVLVGHGGDRVGPPPSRG